MKSMSVCVQFDQTAPAVSGISCSNIKMKYSSMVEVSITCNLTDN